MTAGRWDGGWRDNPRRSRKIQKENLENLQGEYQ